MYIINNLNYSLVLIIYRGVIWHEQKHYTNAVEFYINAISMRPQLTVAQLNLGVALSSLGNKERSLQILTNLLSVKDPDTKDPKLHLQTKVTAMLNIGKILLEMGHSKEAIDVLKKAEVESRTVLQNHRHRTDILINLGECYETMNMTQEAERWYNAALALNPQYHVTYLRYGNLLAQNVSFNMKCHSK